MASMVKCACCGKMVPSNHAELSFLRPDCIAALTVEDYDSRCHQEWEDGYALDKERFFVRGLLPMTVAGDAEEYCLGVWVEVDAQDYASILDDWEAEVPSPSIPMTGWIANQVPYSHNSLGTTVKIKANGADQRPSFYLTDSTCTLYSEQQQGISAHRALEFTRACGRGEHWKVIEEETFKAIPCDCCEATVQVVCGRLENPEGEVDADYWLRFTQGHKNQYWVAVAIANGGERRVASIYGEKTDEGVQFWITDPDDSPWDDFGEYGKVMERTEVLEDLYKSLFFKVVDKVVEVDSRLLGFINSET